MSFQEKILHKTDGMIGIPLPLFDKACARKLRERIAGIRLYAHAYSFNLHFMHSEFGVRELLDFAQLNKLHGIMINVAESKCHIFCDKTTKELTNIQAYAADRSLKINLEISNTTKFDIDRAVKIAIDLQVKNIRLYSRKSGNISKVILSIINDLQYASEVAEKHDLHFVLEQHEALKSDELVHIIEVVDSLRVNILFDAGNMWNANEEPLTALATMSPFIRQAHLKDVRKVVVEKGCGHFGVPSGDGDTPYMKVVFDLLMLGDTDAKVSAFGLQEVVGYSAPPYRFDDEGKDPVILVRDISKTLLNKRYSLEENLMKEKQYASDQVFFVRNLLTQMDAYAEAVLGEK